PASGHFPVVADIDSGLGYLRAHPREYVGPPIGWRPRAEKDHLQVLVDGTPPAIAHSLRDDGSRRRVYGMSILSRSLVPGLLLAAAIPASAQQNGPAAQAPSAAPTASASPATNGTP